MTLPAFKLINVERDGRVLTVRFDWGDASNALSRTLMRELLDLAVSLGDDHELSAIVLTGAPKVFSMGFDLTDPSSADMATASFGERRKVGSLGPRLCRGARHLVRSARLRHLQHVLRAGDRARHEYELAKRAVDGQRDWSVENQAPVCAGRKDRR